MVNIFEIYKKLKKIKNLQKLYRLSKIICNYEKLVENAKNCINFGLTTVGFFETKLEIEPKTNFNLIKYIRKYGYPEDGIFDPILLENI